MKIITFGTLKGGVGKTMLCFHIGGILSQLGNRVLLIDSDLQGNLTNNIGVDRTRPELLTMYDIYRPNSAEVSAQDIILPRPNPRLPNLDIIAGSILMHRSELSLSGLSGRERVLQRYISKNLNIFRLYDYILIDTNPSMSLVNQNAFLVSDSILLVCDVSMNSIEGAQLFIALWEETRARLRLEDNIKGLVINDFDTRNRLSNDFIEYFEQTPELGDLRQLRFNTIIPRTVRITESELLATSVSLYDPHSKACRALSELIQEMADRNIL